MLLWLPAITAAFDGFSLVSAGIGIVSTDAAAIGITAMPTPLADADWPGWVWFYSGAAIVQPSTGELANNPVASVRLPIDSKAMRKWGINEILFAVVEVGTEIGTAQMDMSFSTRILVKLA